MNHRRIAALALSALLCACASPVTTRLATQEDGSYHSIAVAKHEQQAVQGARELVETTCREQDLRYTVLETDSRFRGPPRRTADPVVQIGQLADYVSAPAFPTLAVNDDVEVTLHFRCQ